MIRIAAFVGQSRPVGPGDSARTFIQALERSGHEVVAAFYYPGDSFFEQSKALVPSYYLPEALRGSFGKLRSDFSATPPAAFLRWTKWFDELNIQLGIVFYAGWIPPQLFGRIPMGMVNFHPGPLPELPGYEPETMAILLGIDQYYGTLHRVNEAFDKGEVLWYSPTIRVTRSTGPAKLLYKTTIAALRELPATLRALVQDRLVPPKRDGRSAIVYASRKACQSFAVIDWQRDGYQTILRKNRAFNEQEISLRLLVLYEGTVHVVLGARRLPGGLMRLACRFSKEHTANLPGTRIGRYMGPGKFKGAPILSTLSGPVILKILPREESERLQRARKESSRHRRYYAEK